MSCYHPWTAYRTSQGDVVFSERGDVVSTLTIPCGWCVGCRLDHSLSWAVRVQHETKWYGADRCCWVTPTYDDEHLPAGGSLSKPDAQRLIRSIRDSVRYRSGSVDMTYLYAGEYGDKLGRPHGHGCLMGYRPDDLKPWKKNGRGEPLYRSESLERMWGKGQILVGNLTPETAAYTTRYCLKKVYGDAALEHYRRVDVATGEVVELEPEFLLCSKRPAIGLRWFQKYGSDYFPSGQAIYQGRRVKVPRYYERKFAELEPDVLEDLKLRRLAESRKRFADNSDARLAVKEAVKLAALDTLQRVYEKG